MDEKEIKLKRAKEIGKQISSVRLKYGISREKLAEKSNISTNYLYEIEIGKKVPNIVIFSNICNALEIPADEILNPEMSNELNQFISDISQDLSKLSDKEKELIKNIIHLIANEKK